MPKQVFKLENFHGGLNSSADPRDILDSEASDIIDVMVDQVGTLRTIGSVVAHGNADEQLDNTGASTSGQVPGAGLFYFSHDRLGASDKAGGAAQTGDEYLALYDDSDAQIWIYSLADDDWDDDTNAANNGAIDFLGKSTSAAARPSFTAIDGAVRVSTGEFGKYDSGTDINMGSHLLITATALTVDDGTAFVVGNYIKIDDEILFISAIATHVLTVVRGMFGTIDAQHNNNTSIYILNMNRWYGYVNNNFFQTTAGTAEYATAKWYNEAQHLRSFDELGIALALDDSSAASPDATALVENKIIVSYWLADDGFWSGAYWIGLTPVYIGGQEGPLSTVGTVPLQLNEQILNVQLYVCHPDIDSATVATHPLKDDRIIGVNLYTKAFTSDEWYLLQKFDLTKGGEHGWVEYNDGQTATGFWTDGSAALADPSSLDSYEKTAAVVTVTPGTALGTGRKGIVRVSGFRVSPLYANIDLNSTSAQNTTLSVVNPAPGAKSTFVLEVLDENYDVLYTTQVEKDIADSGASPPEYPEGGGYGSEAGGSS